MTENILEIAEFDATINKNICEIKVINNREVAKMNNKLVEAKYNLTLEEMKLIFLTIVQINTDDEDFKTYKISLKDLEEKTGSLKNHTRLRKFMSSIMKKPIFIDKNTIVNWFSYIHYNENEANLDVRFDKALKPFLLDLKNNFTKFNIQNILTLKSAYAIRIYQLLKQYETISKRKFVIAELQTILQTPKSYQNFAEFDRKVLKVAEKEINAKTDLKVSYEITKRIRRKVVEIEFTIEKNINTVKVELLEIKKENCDSGIKKNKITPIKTYNPDNIINSEVNLNGTQVDNTKNNNDVLNLSTIKNTFKYIKQFKDFREFVLTELNEFYFILNEDIYTINIDLLFKNNNKLVGDEVAENWGLLFKNRNSDNLKLYSEIEYKNYLQLQVENKKKLDNYMSKAITFLKSKTYKITDLDNNEKEYKVVDVTIAEATFKTQIVTVHLLNNELENFKFTASVKNVANNNKIKIVLKDNKPTLMFVK